MNKTKIEYADYTWNPITGCLHGCTYCYARRIAERFADKNNLTYMDGVKPEHLSNVPYPYGFMPTLHTERLSEPQKVKKPSIIFVVSMGDMFGEWVPDEWIEQVFNACEKAPQHIYLFLTKNSERFQNLRYSEHIYSKLTMNKHKNWWAGASCSTYEQYKEAMRGLRCMHRAFLSIEPLLEDLSCHYKESSSFALKNWYAYGTRGIEGVGIDWVIIGAETGNRKDKIMPEKYWVQDIVQICRHEKKPVFMKNSLGEIMGRGNMLDEFVQEFPEEFIAKVGER